MGKIYAVVNGAAPGAAAPVAVTTGTVIKTLLQLSTSANREARIVQHWIEFDGSAAATPIKYELMRHGTVAATVTAYVAGDVAKVNDPNAVATQITLGTANSGYTASVEGTPATVPVSLETHFVPPTSGIYVQFPLGREPEVAVSTFLRQRVTAGAAVNAYCGVMWEE